MAVAAFCESLSAAQLARVAATSRALWGGGRSEAEYAAVLAEQVARAEGRLALVALCADGAPVCSLKRYKVRLAFEAQVVEAVGIGAVITRPDRRREGLAAALVSEVLAQAGGVGLLFSDIAPAYYERLGFVRCPAVTWRARAADLPRRATAWRKVEPEELGAIDEASLRDGTRVVRDAAWWRYFAWRNGPCAARVWDGVGFALVARAGQTLRVLEAGAVGEREPLWAALRAWAESAGCEDIEGWLRDDLVAGGPFTATERTQCIPMIAGVAPSKPHFAEIDHF
jgi:predicted N-acetyltransferase YhbS